VSSHRASQGAASEGLADHAVPPITLHGVIALVVTLGLSCSPASGTIGVRFGRDGDGHLYVRDVPDDLGAARAGIREGDEVILVEGRDVRDFNDAAIHSLLSGERGSRVRLTLLRGNSVLRLSVERTAPPTPTATR
jgi:C-terminal processing protease CtpA/Prc